MPPRKPNMLEAWKASDAADRRAAEPRPAARKPAPRAKESAPTQNSSRRGAPRPSSGGSLLGERSPFEGVGLQAVERAPVFLALTLVALGLLAAAFWLGRLTAPSSRSAALAAAPAGGWDFPDSAETSADAAESLSPRTAAPLEGADPEPSAPPRPTAGPEQAAPALDLELDEEGRTADDRAFYDTSNRFTVRAIYYGNTPKGWKRALAAYRYLRGQGLPTIAPIDQGDIIVVCVGAEPEREGRLSDYRERLRDLPGPPPASEAGAFAGAYFVNIDSLVERP